MKLLGYLMATGEQPGLFCSTPTMIIKLPD